ncbi:lysozyme inhibitor LprI family protein [Sphingoaurantiacus capsulatus]|uniref:Lysozyme inhibitor LprI family protein n=1 Tax=Sphingoaurantiacus capsulatus TaxID=1771310 RepID=A0ABV7X9Y3_9SPHN
MNVRIIAALAATCFAAPAMAACDIAGAASSAKVAACKTDLADSEADLAKAYRRLVAQTPMEHRTQLRKSQSAWLLYRQEHCRFEGTAKPGVSGGTLAVLACTATLNRARVENFDEAFGVLE